MVKKVKSTLYITEDKRTKIKNSGLSLEKYFNKIYETYLKFNMDQWRKGYFSIEYFRVCLLRAESFNYILTQFDDETLLKIGKEMGDKLRITLEKNFVQYFNDSISKIIDYLNNLSGWGYFTVENNTIIVTTPIFTKPHLIKGYLEGLLDIDLTLSESHPDRMIFIINNFKSQSPLW